MRRQLDFNNLSLLLCTFVLLFLLSSCNSKNKTDEADQAGSVHIASAEPQTPEDEREDLHLPPGFKIELFASEPDIDKPMNIGFDARGRMWVTHSREYPFPADSTVGSDRITILEDTDSDGKADKFTTFADSLNIPIGIIPVQKGAVGYSIPAVYNFIDQDRDDRADITKKLYGDFDYTDTHGMVNNLARSFDGWIYACHGFLNNSTVGSIDGDSVSMKSGHTFRFTQDGRNIEVMTTGRVNPFALTFDKWGYRYSSDSHSDPIYQLVPGGDYPQFGKKETGIGYAPHMMDHNHGPTAIAGAALNDQNQFPAKYRNSFFQGNVRSNKILRDSLAWHGATPEAVHKGDFLTSDDPWFRPVAMEFGPDGALYIADFYNRIIGHYEVALDHPGRDRKRGRIWRITYEGKAAEVIDWSTASLNELLEGLKNPHLKTRLQIADQIVYRIDNEAVPDVIDMVMNSSSSLQRAHGIWILERLGELSSDLLARSTNDKSAIVRTHAMRIIGEKHELSKEQHDLLVNALNDDSPHVQRIVVQALAAHPRDESAEPILELLQQIPDDDTHLYHASLLAMRNHLRNEQVMRWVLASSWDEQAKRVLADAMLGVPSERAGDFLFNFLANSQVPAPKMVDYVRHIARYVDHGQEELVSMLKEKNRGNYGVQQTLFQALQEGVAQRGVELVTQAESWAIEIASDHLQNIPESKFSVWHNSLYSDSLDHPNPWLVENIDVSGKTISMLTTRPMGYHLMGILSSPAFSLSESFSFQLYGKDNAAGTSPPNHVRLKLKETGQVIRDVSFSEEELSREIEWQFSEYKGEEAYLEVHDGGTQEFIALGGFSGSSISVPAVPPATRSNYLQFAANITRDFNVKDFEPQMHQLLVSEWVDVGIRTTAAKSLLKFDAAQYSPSLQQLITDEIEPYALRKKMVDVIGEQSSDEAIKILSKVVSEVSREIQLSIARSLSSTAKGAETLLKLGRSGHVPINVLKDPAVVERMGVGKPEAIQMMYTEIIGKSESTSEDDQQIINERLATFDIDEASRAKGKDVFNTYCAACHQVGGKGGVIGPQLDGIGGQGRQALAEAILVPNRTVPESFQLNTIILESGKVKTGLFRREEGELLIFANTAGGEFSIPKEDIKKRNKSSASLMPSNFGKLLSDQQFHDLMAYLLKL